MDLLSEGDTGSRIITARHISAGKDIAGKQNAINTTLICQNYSVQPDFSSYLSALQNYAAWLWASGFIILVTICVLYCLTMKAAWRHSRNSIQHVGIVLAVYPIVAASAYVATIVPRAMLLCEAVAQEAVMIAMYHFFCMVVADCGGADRFVRRTGDCRLETRVLPCCCWPCCVIPRPLMDKRTLTWVRYLVLQMPVVQALVYIVILFMWAEDMMLYMRSFIYLQPFVIASILSGIWGVMMCVRAAETAGTRPRPKLLALQLPLLIVKLQCGVIRVLPQMFTLPCVMSLNPAVFVNLLQNSMTIVEMLLVSALAWKLYSSPPFKAVDKVQHAVIATVDDTVFDTKPLGDEGRSCKAKGNM